MLKSDAYWISHCDDYVCGLGIFEYTCPSCEKEIGSCDLWWNHEDPVFSFTCEKCGIKLKTSYDEGDTYVELD